MKLNRVMWGVILLFVGIVLLLENFNVIEFYWRNVWAFWPVFLIISGVNILFNKNKSQVGNMICIGVLVVILGFVFYKGQQPPANKYWFGERLSKDIDIVINDDKLPLIRGKGLASQPPQGPLHVVDARVIGADDDGYFKTRHGHSEFSGLNVQPFRLLVFVHVKSEV